jgi:large subunit ribosomal protein L10e
MAKIRKFKSYRRLERPYTRVSKFKKKGFIKTAAKSRIVKFVTGNIKKKYPFMFHLHAKRSLQIRDIAFESARQAANRYLELNLGPKGYYFRVRKYTCHILRENPVASGAGADRFSTGMQKSFGKPIGMAARVMKGDALFTVGVSRNHQLHAKVALQKALKKLPCSCSITMETVKIERPEARKKRMQKTQEGPANQESAKAEATDNKEIPAAEPPEAEPASA